MEIAGSKEFKWREKGIYGKNLKKKLKLYKILMIIIGLIIAVVVASAVLYIFIRPAQ